jgi:predicted transcriptional regulator
MLTNYSLNLGFYKERCLKITVLLVNMNQVMRDKPEIIIKILEEAKTPKTIAALSHKANLNLAAGRRYVNALSKANYLDEIEGSKKPEYQINMDGIDFLKALRNSSKGLERFNEYW